MKTRNPHQFLSAAALAVSIWPVGVVAAQPDPLAADATVTEPRYVSAFDSYVKDEEFDVGGWVDANRRVGRIGGWRRYVRDANEPSKPQNPGQSSTPADSAKPVMPGAHSAHQRGTK